MEFDYLETERLLLRKLTPEVYAYVFSQYTDDELYHFFGLSSMQDLEKEKWKYANGLTTFNRRFLYFHIIEKSTKDVIGWCGYHTWYIDHRRAEIGYMLFQDEKMGKGIMSEAVVPVIDYGFNVMNLNRVEAFVATYGTASTRILQALGFEREGLLRSHYCKNGIIEDSVLYALLAVDYVT